MAYTHFWQVEDLEAVARALPAVSAALRERLPRLPALGGPFGQGPPLLSPGRLAFNGAAPLHAEAFVLSPDPSDYTPLLRGKQARQGSVPTGTAPRVQPPLEAAWQGRCTTRALPYDRAVCAALALLRRAAGGAVRVFSTATLREWEEALGPLGLAEGLPGLLGRELWRVATARGEVVAEVSARAEPGQSLPAFLDDLRARGLLPLEGPFVPLEPMAGLGEGWVPLRPGAFVYARRRGGGPEGGGEAA